MPHWIETGNLKETDYQIVNYNHNSKSSNKDIHYNRMISNNYTEMDEPKGLKSHSSVKIKKQGTNSARIEIYFVEQYQCMLDNELDICVVSLIN
uniref:Uncharacterized protein n=1 Tax=Tetranychus urticae TaxID=32264 RepID=A0A158P4D8_TETUR